MAALWDILGTLPDSDDDAPQTGAPAAPPTRAKPRRVTGSADKKRKLGELSGAVSEDLTHCPVCMDWHRGDIFQCPEGHLLCGPCKAGLQNDACPSCRSPLGSIRARAVEKMLQAVVMPCRWHENGCTETDERHGRNTKQRKFKHTCPARAAPTPVAPTKWSITSSAHLAGKIRDHVGGKTRLRLTQMGWGTSKVNYVLIFQRKKRGLFIIYLDVSAGRVLLKARTLFDLVDKYGRSPACRSRNSRLSSATIKPNKWWEFGLFPQARAAGLFRSLLPCFPPHEPQQMCKKGVLYRTRSSVLTSPRNIAPRPPKPTRRSRAAISNTWP